MFTDQQKSRKRPWRNGIENQFKETGRVIKKKRWRGCQKTSECLMF
jgi:hypothetical protein